MQRFAACLAKLIFAFLFVFLIPGVWAGTGFVVAPTYPVSDAPSAGVVGDFNGDGFQDIVTAQGVLGNLSTLLGTGNGKFRPAITSGSNTNSAEAMTAGDFNGDGHLDVVLVGSSNTLALLLGDGTGKFNLKGSTALPGEGVGVAIADLNGDGKLDVVVASSVAISVILGNGDGTFQSVKNLRAGPAPHGIRIDDFNHDGKLDLAVANFSSPGGIDLLLGKGDGTFQAPTTVASGLYSSLTSADLNGDGMVDLVAVSNSNLATVFLGKGNGTFQAGVTYDTGTNSTSILTGDINGDGKLDLIAGRQSGVSFLSGNGDGTFQQPLEYATGGFADEVLVSDFNGDQKLDAATPNSLGLAVSVLLNKGDGTFVGARQFEAGDFLALTSEAAVGANFNSDGKKDIAVLTSGSQTGVHVFLGNGDGTFQPEIYTAAGINPVALAAGDFNKDHKIDLAIADAARSELIVLLGNGDGTFQSGATYSSGASANGVTVADVNRDGVLDVLVVTSSIIDQKANDLVVFLGIGDGTFQPGVSYSIPGTLGERIIVGDINGDGKPDAIVGCLDIDEALKEDVFIFLGNGDGTFQTASSLSIGFTTDGLALADFNGDSKLDLAVNATGTTQVLLGNGDGTFQAPQSIGLGGSGLIALDVNGDHKLDLAIVDLRANTEVFLGKGDGSFAPGKVFGVAALSLTDKADVNQDGADDLLETTFLGNSITVLLNAR